MSRHIPVRKVWEFEAAYCRDPKAWLHQALNLRGNLEALLIYDRQVFEGVFEKETKPQLPDFWLAGVERMLMGFALENLAKAVILLDPAKADQAFAKEGNLRWAVPSHDLAKLLAEAAVDFDDQELIYLELWTTCATWAGRYPLPKNENELPRQRKPAESSGELLKQRAREIEKAISSGTPLQPEQFDLLHTGVGVGEVEIFRSLFERLRVCIENAVPSS